MRMLAEAPPELPKASSFKGTSWNLRLLALTPIYKGGASSDSIDEGMPFRPTSLRGQLRFWWRATADITDPKELWAREQALFGGVFDEKPVASSLRLTVSKASSTAVPKETFCRRGAPLDYALWVQRDDSTRVFHQVGAKATLTLYFPSDLNEGMRRALVGWVLVGGIGSRSRRGLGSIHADGDPIPSIKSVSDYVNALLGITPEGSRSWPSLAGGSVLVGPTKGTPNDAWETAVKAMKDLRSSPFRRKHDQVQPCHELRRDWPMIRSGSGRLEGKSAALGLPIQYEQGKYSLNTNSADGDRIPSPVHIRVVKLDTSKYLPAMVCLRVPYPPAGIEVIHNRCVTLRGRVDPHGLDVFIDAVKRIAGWRAFDLTSSSKGV